MQQGPQTWRDLLRSLSSEEKRTITNALGIRSKTLERWINGHTDLPRLYTLRRLLPLLSTEQRAQFILLIQQDQHISQHAENLLLPGLQRGIPSTFYARVLEANMVTPDHLRFTTICQLVLLQAVGQLDPNYLGLSITILKCTPPSQGKKIRTLSQQSSLGTLPWNTVIEQKSYFLGAESIAGQAVITGGLFVVQDIRNHNDPGIIPIHQDGHVLSAAAIPLQRDERIAGCLLVKSTQTNFFAPSLIKLIQQYSYLLTIALRDDELYEREQIDLQLIPSITEQQYYLAHLRDRISTVIKHSYLAGHAKTWLQADLEIRQQIESELLGRTCAY